MNCPTCTKEVQRQWVACPFCGVRLNPVCSCGNSLDPAWKVCPHCARSVTDSEQRSGISSPRSGVEVPVERCFRIYLAAHSAFFGIFEEAFEKIANASAASEMLQSVSQQRLQARLTSAIESLCESYLSEPEMAGAAIVPIDPAHYSRALQPYFLKIQVAEQALAERDIPDGVLASMWRGAANALTDPTAMTAGAVVPGIGHVLGGLWSGIQMGKKDEEALSAFRDATQAFRNQLRQVFAECYDELLESSGREGTRFSVSAREIVQSLERLDEFSEAIDSANSEENLNQVAGQIEQFVAKYPFSGKAHSIFALALLGLDRCEQAEHEAYKAFTIDNENHLAIIVMLGARVAMERWEDAAQTAYYAIEFSKEDFDLLESIGNAIKRVPNPQFFEDTINRVAPKLQKAGSPVGYLLAARLHGEAGENDRSERMLSHLISETLIDVNEAIFLRRDPSLTQVVGSKFDGVLAGLPNHLRIARAVLSGCDSLWFGSIPAQKRAAAKESFVKLRGNEKLVCYCDTTVFGGGKDGFALTDTRILWHELWKEPVSIRYADIQDFEIASVDDELKLVNVLTTSGKRHEYSEASPRVARGIFNFLALVVAADIGAENAN